MWREFFRTRHAVACPGSCAPAVDDLEAEAGDGGDLGVAAQPGQQLPYRAPAHLVAVDLDGGERRVELRGEIDVAIAGDRYPARHSPAAPVAFLHGADGQRVTGEEDGVDVLVPRGQRHKSLGAALRRDRYLDLHVVVIADAEFGQRGMVAGPALLQAVVAMDRRRDEADA